MIKSVIIVILVIFLLLMIVNCVIMAHELAKEKKKSLDILEKEQREPIRVEKFVVEPVVLSARFAVDYSMLNHLDEDDIHGMMIERFARDFGNYIVENPNLYFMTDCDNPMTMSKVFEARVRIVPWK